MALPVFRIPGAGTRRGNQARRPGLGAALVGLGFLVPALAAVLVACASNASGPRGSTQAREPQPSHLEPLQRAGAQGRGEVPDGSSLSVAPEDAVVALARLRLAEAETLIAAGRPEQAEEILRALAELANAAFPDAGMSARAFLLRAKAAAARGETSLALFNLRQALDTNPPVELRYEINLAAANLRYERGDFPGAFGHYLEALNRVPPGAEVEDTVWLRLAEIAYYSRRDRELARYYLLQSRGLSAPGADSELLRRLVRRLSWWDLSPEALEVGDGNVSAIAADGDDLWIGTWNGGVLRYSLGSARVTVFREGRATLTANTVRCIEVTRNRVWVGTYQGLFVYTKATASWGEVPVFGGANPKRTEAIKAVGEDLYVGTLGDGLWRLRSGRWTRVGGATLPGEFINSLALAEPWLLIGTMNLGIAMLELESGTLSSFDWINPGLEARNIIMLLPVGSDELWIGTYGKGLYRWHRPDNRLWRYDKAGGALGDDWVLGGTAAATGLYFGTFGAGVSRYRHGGFRRLGLREGLAGLDISAVAYAPPYVVFGTLGAGVTLFDETLSLAGFAVPE